MALKIYPNIISFKSDEPLKQGSNPASPLSQPLNDSIDKYENKTKNYEVNKKNTAEKVATGWIGATESIKGFIKGVFNAFVVGTVVAASDWGISGIKKIGKKEIKVTEWLTHPINKGMSKFGKIGAPIIAGVVFVGHILSAYFETKKKTTISK